MQFEDRSVECHTIAELCNVYPDEAPKPQYTANIWETSDMSEDEDDEVSIATLLLTLLLIKRLLIALTDAAHGTGVLHQGPRCGRREAGDAVEQAGISLVCSYAHALALAH